MNLLPIKQRKRVKSQILYQNIIFSGLLLILLVLILMLVLGGLLIFLNFKYQAIEKEIILEQSKIIKTETVKSMERKVRELNKELISLKGIQEKQTGFYSTLSDLSENILKDIIVYTIEIDGDLNKITVSGYSSTREKLLVIKQKLESSYKSVNFPISNLTDPIDINFNFTYEY